MTPGEIISILVNYTVIVTYLTAFIMIILIRLERLTIDNMVYLLIMNIVFGNIAIIVTSNLS